MATANEKTALLPNSNNPSLVNDLDADIARQREWRYGIFMAVTSGILFTANNFFIQWFEVNSLEMLLVRSVVQAAVLGMIAAGNSSPAEYATPSTPSSWALRFFVLVQAVFGALRLYCNFTCLQYMPLGDALTLIFTEPLFTMVFSLIFLRIGIGFWKLLLCLGLASGMLLSIQPPFLFPKAPIAIVAPFLNVSIAVLEDEEEATAVTDEYLYGSALAVACAVCGALANIVIKKCEGVNVTSLVFFAGVAGVAISAVGIYLDDVDHLIFNLESLTPISWGVLLMISTVGVLGYLSMTEALKTVTATSVSVLRALEIVLAYMCQILFMDEVPNLICAAGSMLVMLSVVGIAVEEKFVSNSRPTRVSSQNSETEHHRQNDSAVIQEEGRA